MKHTKRIMVLLVAMNLVVLAGCSRNTASRTSASLIVNLVTGPQNLDVTKSLTTNDTLAANFYVRLVDEQKGKVVPWLAKSWSISPNHLTYSFVLKPGLTFASGASVDASAVKFTLNRGLKAPVSSYFLSDGQSGNVSSVAAPSSEMVVITLKRPDASFLDALAAPPAVIVDPSVASKGSSYLSSHEAGSGPFELVSYKPGQQVILKPRAAYEKWSGTKNPARQIIVNFTPSDTTVLLDARSGAADLTYGMSKTSVSSLRKNSAVSLSQAASGNVEKVVMNWKMAPFNNVAVRQAVALAVPYQKIIDVASEGYGTAFFGPLIPGMPFFDSAAAKPVNTDVARAKQLMSQSGVKTPVKVQLTTLAGDAEGSQIATILQASLAPIGIDLSVAPLTSSSFTDAEFGGKLRVWIESDGPAVLTPPFLLGYSVKCSDPSLGPNTAQMCLPKLDKLIQEATTEASSVKRQELYNQITEVWRNNWSWIPLYSSPDVTVLRKGVTGYVHYAHYLDLRGIARTGSKG